MYGQFAFCCDCQPSYRRNVFLILVVIIFQLFKPGYSVQEYTRVNKDMIMIMTMKLKRIDQNMHPL